MHNILMLIMLLSLGVAIWSYLAINLANYAMRTLLDPWLIKMNTILIRLGLWSSIIAGISGLLLLKT